MKGYKYLALLLVIIFMLSACTKNKSSDVELRPATNRSFKGYIN